jgi:putative Mg2+ transporter-C (MgtC) family protein
MLLFNFGIIEIEMLAKVIIAAILGLVLGLERKTQKYRGLGLRTTMLICVGACLFTITGSMIFDETNLARIAQGLAAGVGFIGAALIWKQTGTHVWVRGLTSAVSVWVLTAIGFAVGAGAYFVAVLSTILMVIILLIKRIGVE